MQVTTDVISQRSVWPCPGVRNSYVTDGEAEVEQTADESVAVISFVDGHYAIV